MQLLVMESSEVQIWWNEAAERCERFFDVIARCDIRDISADYLIELQVLHSKLEKLTPAGLAANAHAYLLRSLAAVIAGIGASLSGNMDKAQAHMDAATVDLYALERELLRLGVLR